jgi:pre-mRNA-splicing factor CDC5/CEF1
MDEDEKEMLSEARARLANTKGKKAKRKARERQLEEARRLSMLQKRRELKAAGVDMKLTGVKKRKYIDFAREVPFQKAVPAGFYDVGEENAASRAAANRIDPKEQGLKLAELEGRHAKEEEEREKARDKKRLKTLFKANAPLVVLNISKANDPATIRKRSALALPAPQVSEGELEEIVKAGQTLMLPPEGRPGRGGSATAALVGDYGGAAAGAATGGRALPARTPLQEDIVMQEARNLRALRDMTPLVGSDAPLPELYEGTGFQGTAPRSAKAATPNVVLATPASVLGGGHGGATPLLAGHADAVFMAVPSSSSSSSAAVGRTPLRDQFGLNVPGHGHGHGNDDAFSVSDANTVAQSVASSRFDRERERAQRAQLRSQLQALPEPEFTYEIALPAVADEGDDDLLTAEQRALRGKPVDAAEAEYQRRQAQEEATRRELARRSSVVKRGLPRPATLTPAAAKALAEPCLSAARDGCTPEVALASAMVGKEMVRLIRNDEHKYPVPDPSLGADPRRRGPPPAELDVVDEDEMEAARELVEHEASAMISRCVRALPFLTPDNTSRHLTIPAPALARLSVVWVCPGARACPATPPSRPSPRSTARPGTRTGANACSSRPAATTVRTACPTGRARCCSRSPPTSRRCGRGWRGTPRRR